MPDRAIAPLEELARELDEISDMLNSGAVSRVSKKLESLLPALASRFEVLEAEIAALKAEVKHQKANYREWRQETCLEQAAVIMRLRKAFHEEGLHGHYNLIQRLFADDSDRSALEEFGAEVRDRALEEAAQKCEESLSARYFTTDNVAGPVLPPTYQHPAEAIRALRGSK